MISSRALDVIADGYSNITYIGQLNQPENKNLSFGGGVVLEKEGVHYTNLSRPDNFLINYLISPNVSYRSYTPNHGDYIKDLQIYPINIRYQNAKGEFSRAYDGVKVNDLILLPNFIRGCSVRFITPPNLDTDVYESEYYEVTVYNNRIVLYSQNITGYYFNIIVPPENALNLYIPLESVLFNQQIVDTDKISNEVPLPPPNVIPPVNSTPPTNTIPPIDSTTVENTIPGNTVMPVNKIPLIEPTPTAIPPVSSEPPVNQDLKIGGDPIAKPTEESLIEIKRLSEYVKQKDKVAETREIVEEIREIKYTLKNNSPNSTNGMFYAILATVIAGVIINKI